MHLGLIGFGSIATGLIDLMPDTPVTRVTALVRPGSDAPARFQHSAAAAGPPVRFVTALDDLLAAQPDLVAECAGHAAVADYAPTLLQSGIDVLVTSVGALADQPLHDLLKAAEVQGCSRLILPSGAIGGLDILRAISGAGDVELTYTGTKPPNAWLGTPAEAATDLATLKTATLVFSGTGRQAALAFPKNANVVAALALAGGGFDRMTVELIADPQAQANQHSYSVVSPHCRYSMTIEATPSPGNARTSITTILSILAEITAYQSAVRSRLT